MREPIGKKRERIVIQAPQESVDSSGYPAKTWTEHARLWARATFLRGVELEAMQKINAATWIRFTIRYRHNDLTEKMRIVWRNENWNIHSILPTEDKFDMALTASKVE